jgi:hypothetical protein
MLRRAGMSLTEECYISSHQPMRVRAASGPAGLFAEDTMPDLRLLLTFRSRATPLIVGAGLANDYDSGLDFSFDFHLFTSPFRFRLLPDGRRRVLSFEAGDHRRSHIQARTGREIDQEERIFFDLRK